MVPNTVFGNSDAVVCWATITDACNIDFKSGVICCDYKLRVISMNQTTEIQC